MAPADESEPGVSAEPDLDREVQNFALILAVERGDHKRISEALKSGADANAEKRVSGFMGGTHFPVLFLAAQKKDLAAVDLLVAAGAETDCFATTSGILSSQKRPLFGEVAGTGDLPFIEAILPKIKVTSESFAAGLVAAGALESPDVFQFLIPKAEQYMRSPAP